MRSIAIFAVGIAVVLGWAILAAQKAPTPSFSGPSAGAGIVRDVQPAEDGPPSPADSPGIVQSEVAANSGADGAISSPEPDWPQWRGPRRDEISNEKGLLPTWPAEGPRLLWKIGDLGRGWSSPIVVRDRLYITGDVGDGLVIFAFDLNGKPLWRAKNGRSWSGSYPGAAPAASTPRASSTR